MSAFGKNQIKLLLFYSVTRKHSIIGKNQNFKKLLELGNVRKAFTIFADKYRIHTGTVAEWFRGIDAKRDRNSCGSNLFTSFCCILEKYNLKAFSCA